MARPPLVTDHGLAKAASELIGPEGEGPTALAQVKPGKRPGGWELLAFDVVVDEVDANGPDDDTGF